MTLYYLQCTALKSIAYIAAFESVHLWQRGIIATRHSVLESLLHIYPVNMCYHICIFIHHSRDSRGSLILFNLQTRLIARILIVFRRNSRKCFWGNQNFMHFECEILRRAQCNFFNNHREYTFQYIRQWNGLKNVPPKIIKPINIFVLNDTTVNVYNLYIFAVPSPPPDIYTNIMMTHSWPIQGRRTQLICTPLVGVSWTVFTAQHEAIAGYTYINICRPFRPKRSLPNYNAIHCALRDQAQEHQRQTTKWPSAADATPKWTI